MRIPKPVLWLPLLAAPLALRAQDANPFPRPVIGTERAARWEFERTVEGWRAVNDCRLRAAGGVLGIGSTGGDPYLHGPAFAVEGPLVVRLRMRARGAGGGQIFWTTRASPGWDEAKSARFGIAHDGEWRELEVRLEAEGTVTGIRLDPGTAPGSVEVDWIEVERFRCHPIEIASAVATERGVRFDVVLRSGPALEVEALGRKLRLEPNEPVSIEVPAARAAAFEAVRLDVRAEGLPPVSRASFLHHPDLEVDGPALRAGGLAVRFARDGSGARIERDGRLVAVLAPLVHRGGAVPPLEARPAPEGRARFEGAGVEVSLELEGEELAVSIRSDLPVEGPVLRAAGPLEEGLFAGLEYLGRGERSSSDLDIETAERFRYVPDPMKVTMPLMAVVVEGASVALLWEDPGLEPAFAAPNVFDGTPDHRMALRGSAIDATVRVAGGRLEDAILWAVRRRGLPELPGAPRTPEGEIALCLSAIRGPLAGEGGWGHCAEPGWGRAPYADFASTIWRLTGEAPGLERLVPGGSHIPDDAAWFVTGRVAEWLAASRERVRALLASQREDGSWACEGPYRRGHFEDTASGFVAQRAVVLLEHARITGDRDALEGGLRAVERAKRFRTPRGAQTWEISLHTPDVLASAYLVWAAVLAHDHTGRNEYLDEARRWAASGLPFVYQWSRHPTMAYATVPVYGATNWQAPNWIGLPVQWCGIVYAYAIALLAPHDDAIEWGKVARGILLAGERMQYAEGPLAGCLPDVFDLPTQARMGPSINPCALVSLRLVLEGSLDGVAVAASGGRRVAAPFPVAIEGTRAVVRARPGARYQVLVDGARVVDVDSVGEDSVPLE